MSEKKSHPRWNWEDIEEESRKKEKQKEAYIPSSAGELYHYTSREVMWKILSNGIMYARHVRFSNDTEEYALGRELLKKYIESDDASEWTKKYGYLDTGMEHLYMICFCAQDDKLSQWRGYAPDGVSIQFDFSNGVFKDEEDEERRSGRGASVLNLYEFSLANKTKSSCDEAEFAFKDGGEDVYIKYFTMPYKVHYTDYTDNTEEDSELYGKLKVLEEAASPDKVTPELRRYIPFIKSASFKEEEEYRLIFDLQYGKGLQDIDMDRLRTEKIQYLEREDGIKRPNILVACGNAERKKEECKSIFVSANIEDKVVEAIEKRLQEEDKLIKIFKYKGKNTKKEIYIGQGSDQNEIFEIVDRRVKNEPDIKLWCDGYLPIRHITVAPCADREFLKQSIEYYKENIPWLKYVEVETSKITFRS